VDLTNCRIGSLVSYLVGYGIRKYNEVVVTEYITSIPRDKNICQCFSKVVIPKNTDKIVGKHK
jgi:hypothetical protein